MKTRFRNRLRDGLGLVSMAIATTGCMVAEVEVPAVQVVRENLVFPGLPAETPLALLSELSDEQRANYGLPPAGEDYRLPPRVFTYSGPPPQAPDAMETRLQLKQVSIWARDELDLSFVQEVTLLVYSPESSPEQPQFRLAYRAPNGPEVSVAHRITIPPENAQGTIDPLKDQAATYELGLAVDLEKLPVEPWSVDLSITFSGAIGMHF